MEQNKGKGKIVLDPGHGQFGNPHTVRGGFYEGTQNFVLAGFLKTELEARGFEVILTRKNIGDDPSLDERGAMAGGDGVKMFLSLHSNAPGSATPPERYQLVRGSEVYYSLTDEEHNKPFAIALNQAVVHTMNTVDRGVKTRSYPDMPGVDYYGVIRHSVETGCRCAMIIEHGFHTNPEDSAFLEDDGCLQKLAAAEAEVIDSFLG